MHSLSLRSNVRSQRGLTLVELLMATVIMAALGFAVFSVLKQVEQDDMRALGLETAKSTNRELLDLVKNDFRFYQGHGISAGGTTMTVTRKQKFVAGSPDASYNVTFRSLCQTPPPGAVDRVTRLYAAGNASIFSGTPYRCLESLACPPGTFPQVQISTNTSGPRIPRYPKREFPLLRQGLAKQSLGTALCARMVGSKIKLIVESVYMAVPSPERPGVITDEILLHPSSGNIQLLPR